MSGNRKPSPKLREWIHARKRHHLSHAHVQMARELGMNPRKLGGLDNYDQEPWKLPLRRFIEHLYLERFGRAAPEVVRSIEDIARRDAEKKERKRRAKERRRIAQAG
ncbi:MAG: hypothetical protein OXC31_25315 [Spirochaetaceae bacterium]|nr:hypothetical protein [Spirochaetaceae bacterium]